jgi:hypothetical protein
VVSVPSTISFASPYFGAVLRKERHDAHRIAAGTATKPVREEDERGLWKDILESEALHSPSNGSPAARTGRALRTGSAWSGPAWLTVQFLRGSYLTLILTADTRTLLISSPLSGRNDVQTTATSA